MAKNYDLYPSYERKIDNWRRRILGYEKMKRDMQRKIQLLKNKNKKQKEVIDKIEKIAKQIKHAELLVGGKTKTNADKILDILKEVSDGNNIYFAGADDYEALKGMIDGNTPIKIVWFEELTGFKDD